VSQPFVQIDATDWEPAGAEQIGSKPKQWLFEPGSSLRWLWKARTFNLARDVGNYPKGDDWAEKVATEVAVSMGIPCAHVELARRGEELGVISRSFVDQVASEAEDLILGNVLLGAAIDGYHPSTQRGGAGYTVESALAVLHAVRPPATDPILTTAGDWFTAYLVLDAWVGNTDRHHQNWGVLRTPSAATTTLAPTYDHASSLGFLLSDDERSRRLTSRDSQYTVDAFAKRAETPFEGRPHPLAAAATACANVERDVVANLLERLSNKRDTIGDVLARIPDDRVTPPALDFASELAAANASEMLLHLGRTLES